MFPQGLSSCVFLWCEGATISSEPQHAACLDCRTSTCRNGNHRQNVFCFAVLAAHQGGIPKINGMKCQIKFVKNDVFSTQIRHAQQRMFNVLYRGKYLRGENFTKCLHWQIQLAKILKHDPGHQLKHLKNKSCTKYIKQPILESTDVAWQHIQV